MRILFVTLAAALFLCSCKSSGKKEKAPPATDTTVVKKDSTPPPVPVVADSVKSLTLTFSGYEEGDYAHLIFTDPANATEYDFGHPEDNNLGGLDVVLKDDKAAFGYKENPKQKGKKFQAELVYKMTDTYDGNGQPLRGMEWRITGLKEAK